MVQAVERIGSQGEPDPFRDLEGFRERNVLVDEAWSEQGVHRVISKRIWRGQEKSASEAAHEPFVSIPLRPPVGVTGPLTYPVVRPHVRSSVRRGKLTGDWCKWVAAVVSCDAADIPATK